MNRFRSKLRGDFEVEAVHWHGAENCTEVHTFLGMLHAEDETDHSVIYIPHGDGQTTIAYAGDVVFRIPNGRVYAHSAANFAALYEPVE